MSPADRFWSHVEPAKGGCLRWTGHPASHGYGLFSIGKARWTPLRWLWQQERGEVQKGDRLGNICGDRLCVCLDHWTLESDSERLRFSHKVDVHGEGGCWLWQGGTTRAGYGLFRRHGGRTCLAHRWSYEQFVGPIPDVS